MRLTDQNWCDLIAFIQNESLLVKLCIKIGNYDVKNIVSD